MSVKQRIIYFIKHVGISQRAFEKAIGLSNGYINNISVSCLRNKNKKSAVVTLPKKIIHLMVELRVFDSPGSYYLFSDDFKPGPEHRSDKFFRDYWTHHVRKDLKFPMRYKFYSLKDTGITNMLKTHSTLAVRDQARHGSLLMTNVYTPQNIKDANQLLLNYEGIL